MPKNPAVNTALTDEGTATTTAPAESRITLTFEPKDAALYLKLVKDAEADDRTPAKFLLIFLRKNYPMGV